MSVTISIVTPSFNQALYLEETIQSVVSQRDHVFDYFVFDGGSTDGSVDIIRKYSSEIDYWVSQPDGGQSEAIDDGFERATGDVLFWLNSDDVLLPGALEKVRRAFDEHPQWDVLSGYSAWIDERSRILKINRIPRESMAWLKWGVIHVCQQTCFFRRQLYHDVGRLDLDLHCVMDTELWCRMLKQGASWGHLPEFLGGFRRHSAMKGMTWTNRYATEHDLLRTRYPEFFEGKFRLAAGVAAHRTSQIASGRQIRAFAETLAYNGRRLSDVFGDWNHSDAGSRKDSAAQHKADAERFVRRLPFHTAGPPR